MSNDSFSPYQFLSQQDFQDILCTCCEGGSNYWLNEDEITSYKVERKVVDGLPEYVSLTVNFDDKSVKVDLDLFNQTIIKMFNGEFGNGWAFRVIQALIDEGAGIDATDADCLLQAALFGDVVYG